MKIEFEITDDQIKRTIEKALSGTDWQNQNAAANTLEKMVKEEVAQAMASPEFRELVKQTVRSKIREMAASRVVSLSQHLIREQVRQMAATGELQSVFERAVKDPK